VQNRSNFSAIVLGSKIYWVAHNRKAPLFTGRLLFRTAC
jgi:hypothetical protein